MEATPRDRASGDVKLFDRIADAYVRKDLVPASRIARRRRLLSTLALAAAPPRPRVLEVGCGAGAAARHLAGWCASYLGIDPAEMLIAHARRLHALPDVEFVVADAYDFTPPERYDVVFAIGVLHHVDDLSTLVRRLVEWVEPGGSLAVNEPHPGNPVVRLARRARKALDPAYSDDQLQLRAGELRKLFADAGLENIRVRAQGLFSTPFAEVVFKPQFVAAPLASIACLGDSLLEGVAGAWLTPLSWNVIVAGRRPAAPPGGAD